MKSAGIALVSFLGAWIGAALEAQQARNCFDAATVELEPYVAPFRRMADIDRDGDLDAIGVGRATDRSFYRIYAYENDGRGFFERGWADAESTGSVPGDLLVEIGDLNGDARADVCILVSGERHDWLGRADGGFDETARRQYGTPARGLVLADLDQDGNADVVWIDDADLHLDMASLDAEIAIGGGIKHGLRVLPQDGPSGSDVFLISAGDELRLFYGSPSLGLVAGPVFEHDLVMPMLDTGDVDGDGDVDALVFGGGNPARFRVLRRTAPAGWTLEPATVGGPAEFLVDVDSDGDLDGACCGGGGGSGSDLPNNVQPTEFQICFNDGSGRFGTAFQIAGLGSPQLAGAVDVDGDGDTDLVAGRCVYFADGPLRPPLSAVAPPPVRGRRDLSDCDGDGDWDVGFSLERVYSNDGAGNLLVETPAIVPPPAGARYEGPGFPGDFDGDADVDLLVELLSVSKTVALSLSGHARHPLALMALLRNDGAGGMSQAALASDPGVTFAVDGREAEDSLVVDVDQDGDLDLLTRTHDLFGATRLWANDGTGFMRNGGTFPERASWAGDVDLDGDLDLITNGTSSSIMRLYLGANAAPGRLPDLVPDVSAGGWPFDPASGIATGDFNQDGYPDFALVSSSTFEVLAFNNLFPLGRSLGANVALDSLYDLEESARVELGDLDLDGLIDALVGTHDGERTDISEVHRKRFSGYVGTNMFQMAQQLVPPGLLVDLDQDGDLDILGSRIAFNRTLP
ncbi:MAG: VCBS repeat-containing protein [Planctomycetes bacterium]|nr:VCBS repeat-containing protein [Planctomycetota bacterium]